MTKQLCFASVMSLLVLARLHADQIVLSNGDKITGTIQDTFMDTEVDAATQKKVQVKKVTVKTDFMGNVSIVQSSIASVTADQPVKVSLRSGEKMVGTVSTEAGEIRVSRPDKTEARAKLEVLDTIRNAEFQKKWEREQERLTNPGLLDFWSGTIDAGLATAQGNASTTTLSTGADVVRRTGFDKISLSFAQIYSTQKTTAPFGKTANRVSGGARYDRDLAKRVFMYGGAAFDFDEFQNLDLRSVLGGGLGLHVIATDTHTFDLAVGGNWNREKFSTGLVRNSGELSLDEKSEHQISQILRVFQRLTVLPNLSDTGEYRLSFDAGMDLKLNKFLSWTFVASDRFLSNPILGNKKNDILITTGLKISFAQK